MSPPTITAIASPRQRLGGIGGPEIWWAERQQILENAGYMLRPRYRPGWSPSWITTGKHYFNSEDGQIQSVSFEAFALGSRAHVLSAAPVHGCNSYL